MDPERGRVYHLGSEPTTYGLERANACRGRPRVSQSGVKGIKAYGSDCCDSYISPWVNTHRGLTSVNTNDIECRTIYNKFWLLRLPSIRIKLYISHPLLMGKADVMLGIRRAWCVIRSPVKAVLVWLIKFSWYLLHSVTFDMLVYSDYSQFRLTVNTVTWTKIASVYVRCADFSASWTDFAERY